MSGAAVLQTPEIQELIELMADPQIHGVVCREFSRLMRPENFIDYGLLQEFANTNTVLYLPEGPIDFSSKIGRFMGLLRGGVAGMERTEILERIWSAKEEKRRAGGFAQSRNCLPFGVDYSSGKWSRKATSILKLRCRLSRNYLPYIQASSFFSSAAALLLIFFKVFLQRFSDRALFNFCELATRHK